MIIVHRVEIVKFPHPDWLLKSSSTTSRSQFCARLFIMWGILGVVALELFRLLIFFIILTDLPGLTTSFTTRHLLSGWERNIDGEIPGEGKANKWQIFASESLSFVSQAVLLQMHNWIRTFGFEFIEMGRVCCTIQVWDVWGHSWNMHTPDKSSYIKLHDRWEGTRAEN